MGSLSWKNHASSHKTQPQNCLYCSDKNFVTVSVGLFLVGIKLLEMTIVNKHQIWKFGGFSLSRELFLVDIDSLSWKNWHYVTALSSWNVFTFPSCICIDHIFRILRLFLVGILADILQTKYSGLFLVERNSG